jgi:ParB/Sulfiredoxin domain
VRSGLVQYHPALEPLLVDIDDESIEGNGMYRPVYAQRTTAYLVAGNSTWAACKQLDADRIPVVWLDLDDHAAYRIMLADNRIAALAQPDNAALLAILDRLAADDSLLGTGYTQTDLDALTALAAIPVEYDQHATWPTLCFQIPPHAQRAFYTLTEVAVGDRERFELLLRLAGWDGKRP